MNLAAMMPWRMRRVAKSDCQLPINPLVQELAGEEICETQRSEYEILFSKLNKCRVLGKENHQSKELSLKPKL